MKLIIVILRYLVKHRCLVTLNLYFIFGDEREDSGRLTIEIVFIRRHDVYQLSDEKFFHLNSIIFDYVHCSHCTCSLLVLHEVQIRNLRISSSYQ